MGVGWLRQDNATLVAYMKAHNISGPAGLEAVWLQKILPTLSKAGKIPVVWQVRSEWDNAAVV